MALSDADGEAEFHLGQASGWHSLYADAPKRSGEKIVVQTRTLDSLAAEMDLKIDAIKIDVEGAELAALHGAAQALQNCGAIFLDIHPQYGVDPIEVCELLVSWGFELFAEWPKGKKIEAHSNLSGLVAKRNV